MKSPTRIGITGGIGSGKSVVTKVFASLNAPTYDADTRARFLVNTNLEIQESIIFLLGKEAFNRDGYNRKFVAAKVFSEPHLLNSLNSIIHPVVADDFEEWANSYQNHAYVVKEAALLFESGSYKSLDKTILVTAPIDIKIDRIKSRDRRSEVEIRKIMDKQWPEEKKKALADYCITNGPEDLLLPQVLSLHQDFSSL